MNSVFQDSPKEIKNGKQVLPIEEYYAKEKWRTAMQPLQLVDEGPPDKEKKELSYWGGNIILKRKSLNCLKMITNFRMLFCYHGSFYNWSPMGQMSETVIAFCYNDARNNLFDPFFEEVTPVRKIYSRYASSEGWVVQTIYVCKKPKQNFNKIKELFTNRIFE